LIDLRMRKIPLPEMRWLQKIPLANGLTVEVWDLSRPIAADTQKVELLFRTPIPLKPEDFTCPGDFAETREAFGAEPAFESRMVKSFVRADDADRVSGEFQEIFRRNLLPYLCRSSFSRSFALSKHREIRKDPLRCRTTPKEK
jgi:hypothetical protein